MLEALKAKAVIAILALPRAWFPEDNKPETDAEHDARITYVVEDIVEEADEHAKWIGYQADEVTALGLAFAYNESAFAWEVHAGEPWPERPSPFGPAGERCFFQLHRTAYMVPLDKWRPFELEEFEALTGLDRAATRRCALAGVRVIAWHAHRCRAYLAPYRAKGDHLWVGAVIAAQYHRPSLPCGSLSTGSIRRGRLYRSMLYQLRKPAK